MNKKILILGNTGKIGIALSETLKGNYALTGKNSKDFDASDFKVIRTMIDDVKPDIVINTVAFMGIDPCEAEPEKAFLINALLPKFLADISLEYGFLFIHFSTDAVFNDEKRDFYVEDDIPKPLNVYGATKYSGDCFIQAISKKYYIFRLPVLFGKAIKNNQFVEKMLEKIKNGQKVLKISDDIISSPTYSYDVALKIKEALSASLPFGLYHIANEGKASLYELMSEILKCLNLDARAEKASYKDFAFKGIKNTFTPIRSRKTNPLRPWREALKDYCQKIS